MILGGYCSYTDIRYKKIFNKTIFLGVVYVFLLYSFLFFILNEKNYISELFLNGVKVFFAGYLLWYLRFWSAGDAKLFTLYSFLLPLDFYSKSYVSYFPSFNLFINLFVPLLLFLIVNALTSEVKSLLEKRNHQKKRSISFTEKLSKGIYSFFKTYLNFLFFVIVFQIIIFFLSKNIALNNIIQNPFIVFGILVIFAQIFMSEKKKREWLGKVPFVIIFVYLIYSLFYGDLDSLWKTMIMTLFFMVLINTSRIILDNYVQKKEVKKIPIGEIREGMIPTGKTFFLLFSNLKNKFGKLRGDGLSEEQVIAIKKFFKDNQGIEVKIYQTLPFAPFIFFAAIISVLTKSSFYEIIFPIFRYFEHLFTI